MRRHWDTASLEELVTTDLVAVIISAATPILAVVGLAFGALGIIVVFISLAIFTYILELVVAEGSLAIEVITVITVVFFTFYIYLITAYIVYTALFQTGSGDDTDGMLVVGCRVGGGNVAFLWWLLIPLLTLGALWVGFRNSVAILDIEILTLIGLIFSALVSLIRLQGIYYNFHREYNAGLAIVACYCIAAGAIESVSFIIGEGSIMTNTLFESNPTDDVGSSKLGMATLYMPLLGLRDLLDSFGLISTSNELGPLGEVFLFNVSSGEGFLVSLLWASLILPIGIYSAGLVFSLRSRAWATLKSIYRGVTGLLIWLGRSVRTILITFLRKSISFIAYALFLRPRG